MTTEEIAPPRSGAPPAIPRDLPRAGFSPRALIALALAFVIVILLTLGLAALVLRNDDKAVRTEVLQVSQRFLTLLTTYNADTLAEQSAEILALSTGQFRSEYTTVTGGEFPARLRETEADSKGRILRIAVTDIVGDDATVLGLVEVTTKNKSTPTPKSVENLIELTLVRATGGWRVGSVLIHGEVG